MRLTKRLAIAATVTVLGALSSAALAADKLIIGTEGAYPPFNNLQADGTLTGFDIDIAKALCDEMKVECTFVAQDWDGIIPALRANKFDAIVASMSITPERDEVVDFTDKYYNTPPAIAVPKDSEITEATPEALDGLTLGAQSSTTHANYAEKYFADSELRRYGTPEEYKLDLQSGRIDAAIDDVVVLSDWINRLQSETGSEFPEKVTAFREGMAVHGRYGKPCPVCGAPVQRIAYASNEANYCVTCQTGGRLLADRSLSRLLREDWPKTLEELERRLGGKHSGG